MFEDGIKALDKRFFFGWEDADLCVRASRKGFKVMFVPGSKIWHKTLPPEKLKRLMGPPVYYAARGRFIFMEKHLTKPQLASSALYFFVRFPKFAWDYSRVLGERKVPLYIAWGVLGYLRRRCQALVRL
jgi:GT2 family glycosyltransferase